MQKHSDTSNQPRQPEATGYLKGMSARSTTAAVLKPLELDTRPIFARGKTPCHAIDKAVASLAFGQPLVITAPFDPVPLYTKLGNLGFSHRTEQLDQMTWRVEFRQTGDGGEGPNSSSCPQTCSTCRL